MFKAFKKKLQQTLTQDNPPAYFELAKDWAYDYYQSVMVSRNRWKAACLWVCLPLIGMLLFMMCFLIPLQHLEPLLITQYPNGLSSVTVLKSKIAPPAPAQVESDLVRYVTHRESYSSASYDYQYNLVTLLSDRDVAQDYINSQSLSNKLSPVNLLGVKGERRVQVENVLFLDQALPKEHAKVAHNNLAQVDFVVTQQDGRGTPIQVPFTAVISWRYRGLPADPNDRWLNWSGFTVTHYTLQQRNATHF